MKKYLRVAKAFKEVQSPGLAAVTSHSLYTHSLESIISMDENMTPTCSPRWVSTQEQPNCSSQ